MSDHIVHQDSGHKLAENSKHNLGGPGPDQDASKQTTSTSTSQPEAEHGKDQVKKVGREQYQDLKDNESQK